MKKAIVNICRLLLAAVFILSGFVKAVDPRGTQYKIEDYAAALGLADMLPSMAVVAIAVVLSALEFCLGIFMLFAIRRRLTSRLIVIFLAVMTPLTLWLAITNPITDCGCFGDALVLTNWQTFWKNVVLLMAAVVVALWPKEMFRFISQSNQWIVINYSMLFILAVSAWSLYDRPQFDFRPYHIGANISEGMAKPEDAEQPQYETTFILEKDGRQQEFTLADYPDSTWTFVDSRSVLIKQGYVPPIHDFSIMTADGDDITEDVLADSTYTMLLIAPHLETADDSHLDIINELYEYARQHQYPFYCLTASTEKAIDHWRDITGAEYPFCNTDDITLKTIIRSNPGLLLLRQGTIIGKWSHNRLPVIEENQWNQSLDKLEIGQMAEDSVPSKIMRIMLWFVLPLALLTIADRIWAWTHWLRRKPKKPQAAPES